MHPVVVLVAYLHDAIEHQPSLPADLAEYYQDELERHLQFSIRAQRDDAHPHDPCPAASLRAETGAGSGSWPAANHAATDGWPDN